MIQRPADLDREADAMEAEAYDCNSVRDRDDLLNEAQTLRARAWRLRQDDFEQRKASAKGTVS